jgi:cyclase
MVEKTAEEVFIPLTVGGGVRSIKNIQNLLKAGADKVSINSAAIKDPNIIKSSSQYFGSQCIVVAVDVKKDIGCWKVHSHGGTKNTNIDALDWLKKVEDLGAGEILLTSMDRDGTQIGYDIELMRNISSLVNIPIIASGGVGNLDHLVDGIKLGNASAVLAASIFHYETHSVNRVKKIIKENGIPVRYSKD